MPDPSPQPGVSDGCGVAVWRFAEPEATGGYCYAGFPAWPTTSKENEPGKWFKTDAQALAEMRGRLANTLYECTYQRPSEQLLDRVMLTFFGDAARSPA